MEFFFQIYIITLKFICQKKKEAGSALQGSKSKQPNQELKFQEGGASEKLHWYIWPNASNIAKVIIVWCPFL